MANRQKKFEVFHRLPLPAAPIAAGSAFASENIVRAPVYFDTPQETLAEVAKVIATDPSIAVRRTTDDRVFHRDELAAMIDRKSSRRLEV